jgi:hypothetical protein
MDSDDQFDEEGDALSPLQQHFSRSHLQRCCARPSSISLSLHPTEDPRLTGPGTALFIVGCGVEERPEPPFLG